MRYSNTQGEQGDGRSDIGETQDYGHVKLSTVLSVVPTQYHAPRVPWLIID